jgi:beta-N-acetylhexosaminidase
MRNLIADLQAAARIPLLIATDQEGGRVSNLNANNGFSQSPLAYAMGLRTAERYSEQIGDEFAHWFCEVGLNTDFAPVVDLRLQPGNVIGDRSFSADPDTVVLNASWFIDAFRRRHLITALKHFPGHGSSIGDSHAGFTDVSDTWTEAELEPFKRLIDAGQADLIMTAHIFNSRIDSLFPATLCTKP